MCGVVNFFGRTRSLRLDIYATLEFRIPSFYN